MVDTINIDEYPELALLAWNRAVRTIDPEEAFALYEANWRFVDQDRLTDRERALIKELAARYGQGVMNV